MKPLISVIMSVYGEPAEWICKAIESILFQTCADFELIIINDNPAREVNRRILNHYQSKDPRVVLIRNEENIGLTKSLNRGLAIAKGEYIARMDADDVSFPERFEVQLDWMEKNREAVACGTYAYILHGEKVKGTLKRPPDDPGILYCSFSTSPFLHPSLMIRHGVMRERGIRYDESFVCSQDYRLAFDLMEAGRIGNIPQCLLYYRVSPGQVSEKHGAKQEEQSRIVRRKLIDRYYKRYAIPELDREVTLRTIWRNEWELQRILSLDTLAESEKREVAVAMNCIRRLLYYSLARYSSDSLWHFLRSGDYVKCPYKARRFFIILIKHILPDIVPKLV